MKRSLPLFSLSLALGSVVAAAEDPRAIHERLLTFDTHLDTPSSLRRPGWSIMDRHDVKEDFTQVDQPRMVEGGLDGGFWVIYTPQGPRTPAGHAAARDTAIQIAGMEFSESEAFLGALRQWATQPAFVYRHTWQMGDLLIWDNTGTMHRVLPFPEESGRQLHRFTLNGEEPVSGQQL